MGGSLMAAYRYGQQSESTNDDDTRGSDAVKYWGGVAAGSALTALGAYALRK